jgi:hypothetical protein
MYEDFVQWVATKPSKDDELVRRLYASRLKKSNQEASKLAHFSSSVVLKKSPLDFSAKRAAILAGYREGTRVIKALREIANSAAN